MQSHILSIILFTPLAGALLLIFVAVMHTFRVLTCDPPLRTFAIGLHRVENSRPSRILDGMSPDAIDLSMSG